MHLNLIFQNLNLMNQIGINRFIVDQSSMTLSVLFNVLLLSKNLSPLFLGSINSVFMTTVLNTFIVLQKALIFLNEIVKKVYPITNT